MLLLLFTLLLLDHIKESLLLTLLVLLVAPDPPSLELPRKRMWEEFPIEEESVCRGILIWIPKGRAHRDAAELELIDIIDCIEEEHDGPLLGLSRWQLNFNGVSVWEYELPRGNGAVLASKAKATFQENKSGEKTDCAHEQNKNNGNQPKINNTCQHIDSSLNFTCHLPLHLPSTSVSA
ncbi:hypothetical protein AKJ16_DCAP04560 [Drosera capensis]